jgi:hypothetical protein
LLLWLSMLLLWLSMLQLLLLLLRLLLLWLLNVSSVLPGASAAISVYAYRDRSAL